MDPELLTSVLPLKLKLPLVILTAPPELLFQLVTLAVTEAAPVMFRLALLLNVVPEIFSEPALMPTVPLLMKVARLIPLLPAKLMVPLLTMVAAELWPMLL